MDDFAEQLIAQQRIFAKQMLKAASRDRNWWLTPPKLPVVGPSPMAPASNPDASSTTTRITPEDLPPGNFPAGEPER